MKYILTLAFMLLVVIKSNGQKQRSYLQLKDTSNALLTCRDYDPYSYIYNDTVFKQQKYEIRWNIKKLSVYLKNNSDTLEIYPDGVIKFIKIGERVYKIESPTLIEVNKYNNIQSFKRIDDTTTVISKHKLPKWANPKNLNK